MQTVIDVIFSLVLFSFVLPFIFGILEMCEYITRKAKGRKWLKPIFFALFTVISLAAINLIFQESKTTEIISVENYLKVTVYTIVLAIFSSNFARKQLYQDRKEKIDSVKKAFKKGYTKFSAQTPIVFLPINIFLYGTYLLCLIVSQLSTIPTTNIFSPDFIDWCRLHEYGIIILVATKEFLGAFNSKNDKERNVILHDILDKDIIGNNDNESRSE